MGTIFARLVGRETGEAIGEKAIRFTKHFDRLPHPYSI
jgi:hypothetical protein